MNPPERFGEIVAKQLENYSIKAKAIAEKLKKAGDEALNKSADTMGS